MMLVFRHLEQPYEQDLLRCLGIVDLLVDAERMAGLATAVDRAFEIIIMRVPV